MELLDKLNTYRGSFLDDEFDEHMKNVWGVENFDIIVGNPPYQMKVGPKKTEPLWNRFVKKSVEHTLKGGGYLVTVHPSGWRNVDGKFKDVQNLIKNHLTHLSTNDDKKGQEVFGATTSFDWYCYKKGYRGNTYIVNEDLEIDLSKWEFIPNGMYEDISRLLPKEGEDTVDVLYSSSKYETRNNHMSKIKTEEFKYPCVYTITKDNTINKYWSSVNDKGHFGLPKVMWSNGMASPPTIDKIGEYGLTQFAYAIVDDVENLENIRQCMCSDGFLKVMEKCYMSSGDRFNRKIISTFRKDFWKPFIKPNP